MEKMRGHNGKTIELFKGNASARGVFKVKGIVLTRSWNSISHFHGRPMRDVEWMKENKHRHSGEKVESFRIVGGARGVLKRIGLGFASASRDVSSNCTAGVLLMGLVSA